MPLLLRGNGRWIQDSGNSRAWIRRGGNNAPYLSHAPGVRRYGWEFGSLDEEARCGGRGVEFPIGRDERDGTDRRQDALKVQIEDRGELHGVVGAEGVGLGEGDRPRQQGGADLPDSIFDGPILTESDEDGRGDRERKPPSSLPTDDGGGQLDRRDTGEVDSMGCWGIGQALDPTRAGLGDVALDDGAGIEEIDRHFNVARG